MKVHIIYHTRYGNNELIVQDIMNALAAQGHQISTTSALSKGKDISGSDLYVFSCPIHGRKPARAMRKFIKRMEVKQEDHGEYACVITHAGAPGNGLEKLEAALDLKGLTRKIPGISIKVKKPKGPLEEGYKLKANMVVKGVLQD